MWKPASILSVLRGWGMGPGEYGGHDERAKLPTDDAFELKVSG